MPNYVIIGLLALVLAAIAFLLIADRPEKMSGIYPVKCTVAGITIVDGWTWRRAVIRMDYVDRESKKLSSAYVIPGMSCVWDTELTAEEWKSISTEGE